MSERRLRSFWILFAAWLVVMVYAFPGYMNWDAGAQLAEARSGELSDWYPPMMGECWRAIEVVIAGPAGMLILQTSLFLWGLHALLRTRLDDRTAAIVAAALMLFPPILTPMTAVWKDAQMAGFLMAGLPLAMRPRWRARALGLFLLFLAAAVRDNAALALPPLCLLFCGTWGFRRRIVAFLVAAGVCVGLVGASLVVNKQLTHERTFPWYRSVGLMDIAGTICNAGPMSDAELTDLLAGTGHIETTQIQDKICGLYSTRVWFALDQGDEHYWTDPPKLKTVRMARRSAWWRVVSEHPGAYLAHRANVMAELLGLTDSPVWEPVCQTADANPDRSVHHDATQSWIQRTMGGWFDRLGQTIVYRPWAYAVLSLVFFGFALVRRDRFLLAVTGSGLLYELSYFFLTGAPDFRYSHWMIVCTVIAGVTIFVERLRRRLGREAVV